MGWGSQGEQCLNPRAGKEDRRDHTEQMVDVWNPFPEMGFFPFTHEPLQNFIFLAANRVLLSLNRPLCFRAQSWPFLTGREKTDLNPGQWSSEKPSLSESSLHKLTKS